MILSKVFKRLKLFIVFWCQIACLGLEDSPNEDLFEDLTLLYLKESSLETKQLKKEMEEAIN